MTFMAVIGWLVYCFIGGWITLGGIFAAWWANAGGAFRKKDAIAIILLWAVICTWWYYACVWFPFNLVPKA